MISLINNFDQFLFLTYKAHVRRHQAQKRRTAQLKALVRLQAFARGIKVRRDIERTRRAVRVIEEHYGAHQQRQRALAKYRQIRRSVVAIQALARGAQVQLLLLKEMILFELTFLVHC